VVVVVDVVSGIMKQSIGVIGVFIGYCRTKSKKGNHMYTFLQIACGEVKLMMVPCGLCMYKGVGGGALE
jgi:hypothetical protein